jgi:hypothetical protein
MSLEKRREAQEKFWATHDKTIYDWNEYGKKHYERHKDQEIPCTRCGLHYKYTNRTNHERGSVHRNISHLLELRKVSPELAKEFEIGLDRRSKKALAELPKEP